MATDPISATAASLASSNTLSSLNQQLGATGGNTTLGQSDFLNLLVQQLQNQDPLQPMQDTDFIAEMANFSSLQQMTTLTSDFSGFSSGAQVNQAQQYLGQQVTVTDPTLGAVTGTVTAIDNSSGTPQIVVNGQDYALSAVQSISLNQNTNSTTTNPTN